MACNTENTHVKKNKQKSRNTHVLLHKPWDKTHYLQTEQ